MQKYGHVLQPDSQSYTFVEGTISNRETEATEVKLCHLQTHHKVHLFWTLSTIQRDKKNSEPSSEAAASKPITLISPKVSVCLVFSLVCFVFEC